MRIYQNCREMHSEVKRDIHEMGTIVHPQTMQDKHVAGDSRFQTLELSPCDFTILDGSDRNDWLTSLGKNLDWARAEFEERTGPEAVNPGEAWQLRRETWSEFIHDQPGRPDLIDPGFAYTYSERLCDQLPRVLYELRANPDSRQCVIPIFQDYDTEWLGGKRRVPCSMYYQLMRREGGLRLIYTMRSSDFVEHFPYDIWLALEMQAYFARHLEVPIERFTFFSGSLHIYMKDMDRSTF